MTYQLTFAGYLAIGIAPFLALWFSMFAAVTAKNAEERRQANLVRRLRGR